MKKNQMSVKEEKKIIFEMIDASWELAQRLGKHPVKTGCNCISCVNKRKRILKKQEVKWMFNL
jgi:hypothetical protein